MKQTALIVAMVLLMPAAPGLVRADEESLPVLIALSAMAVVDYRQSCEAFYGPDADQHWELNPLLGKYPERRDMILFGVVGVGLVYAARLILPDPWGQVVADSALASEQINIEENAKSLDGHKPLNAVPIVLSFRF